MTFAQKLLELYTGAMLTKMVDIGYDTGLFEASRAGAATSEQLANPTLCTEWTVKDVINHMVTGATMFAISAEQGSVPDDVLGKLMGADNVRRSSSTSARTSRASRPASVKAAAFHTRRTGRSSPSAWTMSGGASTTRCSSPDSSAPCRG